MGAALKETREGRTHLLFSTLRKSNLSKLLIDLTFHLRRSTARLAGHLVLYLKDVE